MSGPQEGDVIEGGTWDGFTLISRYTRAQGIEDGFLIDVSEVAKEAGFTVPVALTSGVWFYVNPTEDEAKSWGQDEQGRLWDVLTMARFAIRASRQEGPELLFSVLFQMRGRPGERSGLRKVQLKLHSGPGDEGEHVITILLPHED